MPSYNLALFDAQVTYAAGHTQSTGMAATRGGADGRRRGRALAGEEQMAERINFKQN